MHEIRIIALDLDGTLLDSDKKISPANLEALEAAASAGIELVPATGRLYRAMPEAVLSLPFVHYAITVNGALVLDTESGETIFSCDIPNADALSLCAYLKNFPVLFDCYWDGRGFTGKEHYEHAENYISDRHSLKLMKELRSPVPDLYEFLEDERKEPHKMQAFTKDKELRGRLIGLISEKFPQFAVTASLPENIEINNINIDKGKALLGLADKLGIPQKQTMAFGDGLNDIAMIRAAGIGVAMGNAHTELKKAADLLTEDCDHDGVAVIVKKLLKNSGKL